MTTNHATLADLKARRANAMERCKGHDPRTAQWRGQAEGEVRALTQAITAWEQEHGRLREKVQEIVRYSPTDGISHSALDHIERIVREFEG